MSNERSVPEERIDALHEELDRDAESSGYHLNPDREFTRTLVEGLLVNEGRYGYRSCPCRLAAGDEEADRDIVCPCDYRDADITEWGACYCALYVSEDVLNGRRELTPVPERRPPEEERAGARAGGRGASGADGGTAAPAGNGGGSVTAEDEGAAGSARGTRSDAPAERRWKSAPVPVWRCRVCGYLCAREGPPDVCPVCKARKERFELFWE